MPHRVTVRTRKKCAAGFELRAQWRTVAPVITGWSSSGCVSLCTEETLNRNSPTANSAQFWGEIIKDYFWSILLLIFQILCNDHTVHLSSRRYRNDSTAKIIM